MKHLFFLLLCVISLNLYAQTKTNKKQKTKLFFLWGYNRDFFTHSTIHFKGSEYNFNLKAVHAQDRQSPFNFKTYFNIASISVPQYNISIGALFTNNWSISFGLDHMKYVVEQYSNTIINGNIENGTEFDGTYSQQPMQLTSDFLQFEHTNGLNYLHLSAQKEIILAAHPIKHIDIKAIAGGHVGVLVPRSDVTLMHYNRNDEFHLAGYGLGIGLGLKAEIFKNIIFRLDNKSGFINMPDILTRGTSSNDRAKQYFGFTEFYYSLGYQHSL